MAARGLQRALAAICLLATLQTSLQRSLQQASQSFRISTKLYSGIDNGGLSLSSNYTLYYQSNGNVTRGSDTIDPSGYPLSLSSGDLLLSDTFKRVGCIQVGLNPTSAGIGGFVSSYPDVVGTTSSSGIFRISTAVILDGTNVSSADNSTHFGAANPSEEYVFLIYNLGRSLTSTKVQITAQTAASCSSASAPAPSVRQTPFVARAPTAGTNNTQAPQGFRAPANVQAPTAGVLAPSQNTSTVGILPVQNTSSSGTPPTPAGRRLQQLYNGQIGYSTVPAQGPSLTDQSSTEGRNAPAPGPSAGQTDSVQITRQDALSDSRLVWMGGFTNVSCIAYKVLGQQNNSYGRLPSLIDLSIFLLDENNTISWASQRFSLTPDNIDFQAITLQSNANNEAQFTYLDGLDPSARYFLWTVTGMQQPSIVSSNVILDVAFTGQNSGSCSNNQVSQYAGSSYQYSSSSSSSSSSTSSSQGGASADAPVPSRGSPATGSVVGSQGGTGTAPMSGTSTAPTSSEATAPTGGLAPEGGLTLQGSGSTNGGNTGLFPLPGKKLRLLR